MTADYSQPSKQAARERVLIHAVESLTTHRITSPLIPAEDFKRTLGQACKFLEKHCALAASQEVWPWEEAFLRQHSSAVGTRSPADLSVLFLAGDDPTLDIMQLEQLGVSPQNMWAVERDGKTFSEAIERIRETGYPVKAYRGNLHEFFEVAPQQFDIVYFDSCSPLFGGDPNSVHPIRELFLNQRLSPLSALITNFSEANQDGQHAAEWARRIAPWMMLRDEALLNNLLPEEDKDLPEALQHVTAEEALVKIGSFENYVGLVSKNLPAFYSEFITRFVLDFGSVLLPWWRVAALPGAQSEYFKDKAAMKEARKLERINQEKADKEMGPCQWGPTFPVFRRILSQIQDLPESDPVRQHLFEHELHEVKLREAIRDVYMMKNLIDSPSADDASHLRAACNDELVGLADNFRWFDYDHEPLGNVLGLSPQLNLLTDLFIGLYGYPYHANLKKHVRFKYKAEGRATWMYSDVFVLDQARYFYGLMPTLSVVGEELEFGLQLALRVGMHLIRLHAMCGYEELFAAADFSSEVTGSIAETVLPHREVYQPDEA